MANDLTGWRIALAIEPSPMAGDVARMAAGILADRDNTITINDSLLGIAENGFRSIERVFAEGAQINLYLEEDMLLAPDATRLAAWYFANHKADWLCLNLIGGGCASAGLISNPDYPDMLLLGRTFNSLGFAVRREEWEHHMRAAWKKEAEPVVKFDGALTGGWDWAVSAMLMKNPSLHTVQPVLARATHTGRRGGQHCTTAFHDEAFAELPLFTGSPVATTYRLVPHELLPSVVRRHARLWLEMTWAWNALAQR
jgi:hypothetical protein